MTHARLALFGWLCCVSCSKPDPAPHRTEPWLAHPSASAGGEVTGGPLNFHFAPDSSIRFTLLGRKAKLSGRVSVAGGGLRLDPRDLTSANASVDVDLTTLSIDADSLREVTELGGGSPSALAQQWLELGPQVAPEKRRELSIGRFELSSVETSSSPGLDWGAAHAKNHVRARVVGTLLLHGFRAPVVTDIVLSPLETSPGTPRRLSIRSQGALVVALAPHDIRARGPSGIADALATARSADWVGKSARIEFELVAEADRTAAK